MATAPLPPDWSAAATAAARLAAWTTLSIDRFADAYKGHYLRDTARAWALIEQQVGATRPAEPRSALILAACAEAETGRFLRELALYVARIESNDGRAAAEVRALIAAFDNAGELHGIAQIGRAFLDDAAIVALYNTRAASAYVQIGNDTVGTACLVRPHLILTAAHVVLERTAAGWSTELKPGLSFCFKRAANDPTPGAFAVPPLGGKPVSHSPPHQQPPVPIEAGNRQQAAGCLDFALVRLAQQVEHIAPIDIDAPMEPVKDQRCLIMGFAGGRTFKWDDAAVIDTDLVAGRMLHRANAIGGMSGGICIGSDGSLLGLHEGAIDRLGADRLPMIDPGTNRNLIDNRAVCLAAIRAMQRANGATDPLRSAPGVPGVGFEDPTLGQDLYQAGLRLAGPAGKASWGVMLDTLLGAAAAGDRPMPVFHPWFERKPLEDWIAKAANPRTRLRFVTGEAGTGKSFCARILRGMLANPNRDMTVLRPTQANNWAWSDAVAGLKEATEVIGRTRQGAIRYDDVPALVAELGLNGTTMRSPDQPRFIVMDFENAKSFRIDDGPWRSFIATLLAEPWARLLIIGLPIEVCDEIETLARTSAASRDVEIDYFNLEHLKDNEFASYVVALGRARGRDLTAADARALIGAMRDKVATLWSGPQGVEADIFVATMTVRSAVVACALDALLRASAGGP